MKKNTLLYLDEELVKQAKMYHLNISKVAEDAVRSHLFPMQTKLDFWTYIEMLEKDGRAFFLPVKIKRIKITNVYPIKDITTDFGKFNIITGKNSSGKTTMLRLIASFFGQISTRVGNRLIKDFLSEGSSVDMEVFPEKKYHVSRFSSKGHIKCILIDDCIANLDATYYKKFIAYLKRLNMQVIITDYDIREDIDYKDTKLITL